MKFLIFIFIVLGVLISGFVSAEEKIDINTAPLEDLIKIIHIGEIRASELISLRPFSSLDDLVRINGLSEKRVEDIKSQGLASINPQEKPEIKNSLESEVSSNEKAESPLIVYPFDVVINEIMPSPIGTDSQEEWIEIFNQNPFDIGLFEWKLTDIKGKTNTYVFPKETTMAPKSFLVLVRPTTNIVLNNDGDGLNLIQPNDNIIDTVNYEKAEQGKSFNRVGLKWEWNDQITPGKENKVIRINNVQKSAVPDIKNLAVVKEQIGENNSASLVVPLIALPVAVFSSIIILLIKKKLRYKI
ncbi:MAG: lamin tail domain-containing protein [Candidatus Nealsonbacteria bacterium]|nr:lamin tail domain-containing protein [Candidatus Nealsonbacteria bacterium]